MKLTIEGSDSSSDVGLKGRFNETIKRMQINVLDSIILLFDRRVVL